MCFSCFYEPLHNLFHASEVSGRRGISQSYGGADVHQGEPLETPQPCSYFPTTIIYHLEMSNLPEKKYVLNLVKIKSSNHLQKPHQIIIVDTHTKVFSRCLLLINILKLSFTSVGALGFFLLSPSSLVQIYILPSVLRFRSDPPHQALIHHFNSHLFLTPPARWRHPRRVTREFHPFYYSADQNNNNKLISSRLNSVLNLIC